MGSFRKGAAAMRGKKPTLAQKKFLKAKGLNPANWLVVSEDGYQMVVIHRESLNRKTIRKEGAQ